MKLNGKIIIRVYIWVFYDNLIFKAFLIYAFLMYTFYFNLPIELSNRV